jgi:hypothetical protein
MHAHSPYSFEHLQRLGRQIPEIDEVTIDVLLSTRTSPTTESINVIKSWKIRSHEESNSGPEVLLRLL